jgi:beta-glucosidase
MNIKEIISQLSLDEKFALLTGKNKWQTINIERLGIPSITISDGPHGVRKEYRDGDGSTKYHEAISFPTAAALAATWNPNLVCEVGKALGKEASRLDVDIILGPGVSIKRVPQNGRNFEYFSEDPLLAGDLAAAYIEGVQSEGVGTSLKHYAGNNQEFDRNSVSSEIDERTLREIYLKPFEIAVKKAQPWTVMSGYNRVNGIYCSEHRQLLKDYLREEFGFEGFVMSDWWAVHDRAKALKATLELEMPVSDKSAAVLQEAYDCGEINDEDINSALERLLKIVYKAYENRKSRAPEYDLDKQHNFAKEVALEAITLLKNEERILPINKEKIKKLAIIGQYAVSPVFQGGGSACVTPTKVDNAFDIIKEFAGEDIKIEYSTGYSIWAPVPGVEMLSQAMEVASESDMSLVFVGNNNTVEGEAHDRDYITLAPQLENMIIRVASQNPNTVVVIQAGSAIHMSAWIDKVKAVVFAWYPGQAGGSAVAEILFGKANPSGKIAETFPLSLKGNPSYDTYPGNGFVSWYREGVLVGYRYYDTYSKEVLYPFGHGLSYTTFEYSDLLISPDSASAKDDITVRFKVKNIGSMQGKETVQLYVKDKITRVIRPDKELKAYNKIELMPGEEKEITFSLGREAFEYYSTSLRKWTVDSGAFQVLIGASSRDIRLKGDVYIMGDVDFS